MKKVFVGILVLAMFAFVVAISLEFVNLTPDQEQVAEQPSQTQVEQPPVETMAVDQQGMVFRPPTPPDENLSPSGPNDPGYCPLGFLCCENDKFRVYVSSELACPEQHLDVGAAPLNCSIGPVESYHPNVYKFATAGGQPVDPIVGEHETDLAVLTTPTPGSVLSGPDAVFMWNPATRDRIRDYYVAIGTEPRKSDLFWFNTIGSNLAVAVEGLPVDGSDIYVTLYSAIPTVITMEAKVVETTIADTNGVHSGFKWGEVTFP